MASITVRDLIIGSYITSGDVANGETPDDIEAKRGLQKFNDIVSSLSLDNLWSHTLTKVSGSLTSGQSIYSVGNEGVEDFATPRPPEIVNLNLNIGSIWYPIRQVSLTQYYNTARSQDSSGSSIPTMFAYDPAFPSGNILFYPEPSSAYQIQFTTRDMKIDYTLDDTLDLPAGYNAYLDYGLASVLAVDGGVVDRADLVAIASTRLAAIKTQNIQSSLLEIDQITDCQSGYNIHTDSFGGA